MVPDVLFDFDDLDEVLPSKQDSRARAIRRRRNTFRLHPTPSAPMGKVPRAWQSWSSPRAVAPELTPLVDWFEGDVDNRDRFRWALRDSLDELLDGQRTGRWAYQHLSKTEKTYLGTAVEVNLTKEFDIPSGRDLDWQIQGIDIDCKFSKDLGGWEIPMEMYLCSDHGDRQGKANHPALLTWLNDDESQWAAGLITITDQRLRWRGNKTSGTPIRAYNRDNKRKLQEFCSRDIFWLWEGIQADLPTNLLRHLSEEVRGRIFDFPRSGQKRVNQLFREVQGKIIGRQTVLTVAQQDDAPKRARDARKDLRAEGVLVLGHEGSHPRVAGALSLPVPVKGEWVAVRVTELPRGENRPCFDLEGKRWAKALENEPGVEAPDLPTKASVRT